MTFFSRAIFSCVYTTLIFVLYLAVWLCKKYDEELWDCCAGCIQFWGREVLFICFQTAFLTTYSSFLIEVQKFHCLNHSDRGLHQVLRTSSNKEGRDILTHHLRALTIKSFMSEMQQMNTFICASARIKRRRVLFRKHLQTFTWQ